MARVLEIGEGIKLIDVSPPALGFEGFGGCYILEGERAALLDPGPSAGIPKLLEGLEILKVNPERISLILLTHIHIDHAGGAGDLIQILPKAQVLVHERGGRHLIDPSKLIAESRKGLGELAEICGPMKPVPPDRIVKIGEKRKIQIGDFELDIIPSPGHASHHLCFLTNSGVLFVGDAAGVYHPHLDVIRPATPPPFDLDLAIRTLEELEELGPQVLCYPHFGRAGDARRRLGEYREKLLLWREVIREGLEEGRGESEILEILKERDPDLRKVLFELPEASLRWEKLFIENSIKGFIFWLERKGKVRGLWRGRSRGRRSL